MTNIKKGDIVALTESLKGSVNGISISEPKGTVAKVVAVSDQENHIEIETATGVLYRVYIETVMETDMSDEKFDKIKRHSLQ